MNPETERIELLERVPTVPISSSDVSAPAPVAAMSVTARQIPRCIQAQTSAVRSGAEKFCPHRILKEQRWQEIKQRVKKAMPHYAPMPGLRRVH